MYYLSITKRKQHSFVYFSLPVSPLIACHAFLTMYHQISFVLKRKSDGTYNYNQTRLAKWGEDGGGGGGAGTKFDQSFMITISLMEENK